MSHCKAFACLSKVTAALAGRLRCKDVGDINVAASHQLALSAIQLLAFYNESGLFCTHRQRRNVWIAVPRQGRSSFSSCNASDVLGIAPMAADVLAIIAHLPHATQVVCKYPTLYTHFVTRVLSNALRVSCPSLATTILAAQINLTHDTRVLRSLDVALGSKIALLCTQTAARRAKVEALADFDLDSNNNSYAEEEGEDSSHPSRRHDTDKAPGCFAIAREGYANMSLSKSSDTYSEWEQTTALPTATLVNVESGRKLLQRLACHFLARLRCHLTDFDTHAAVEQLCETKQESPIAAALVCTAFSSLLQLGSTTRWFEQDVLLTETILDYSQNSFMYKITRAELILFLPVLLSALESNQMALSTQDVSLVDRCVQNLYLIRHIRRVTAVRAPSCEELSAILCLALCRRELWRQPGQRALTVVLGAYPNLLASMGALKRGRVLRYIISIVYDNPANLFAADAIRSVILPIFYCPQGAAWALEHTEPLTLRQHRRLANLLSSVLALTIDHRVQLLTQEKAQMVQLTYQYMSHIHKTICSSDARLARQAATQWKQLLNAELHCVIVRLGCRDMAGCTCWTKPLPEHCVSVLHRCEDMLRMLSRGGELERVCDEANPWLCDSQKEHCRSNTDSFGDSGHSSCSKRNVSPSRRSRQTGMVYDDESVSRVIEHKVRLDIFIRFSHCVVVSQHPAVTDELRCRMLQFTTEGVLPLLIRCAAQPRRFAGLRIILLDALYDLPRSWCTVLNSWHDSRLRHTHTAVQHSSSSSNDLGSYSTDDGGGTSLLNGGRAGPGSCGADKNVQRRGALATSSRDLCHLASLPESHMNALRDRLSRFTITCMRSTAVLLDDQSRIASSSKCIDSSGSTRSGPAHDVNKRDSATQEHKLGSLFMSGSWYALDSLGVSPSHPDLEDVLPRVLMHYFASIQPPTMSESESKNSNSDSNSSTSSSRTGAVGSDSSFSMHEDVARVNDPSEEQIDSFGRWRKGATHTFSVGHLLRATEHACTLAKHEALLFAASAAIRRGCNDATIRQMPSRARSTQVSHIVHIYSSIMPQFASSRAARDLGRRVIVLAARLTLDRLAYTPAGCSSALNPSRPSETTAATDTATPSGTARRNLPGEKTRNIGEANNLTATNSRMSFASSSSSPSLAQQTQKDMPNVTSGPAAEAATLPPCPAARAVGSSGDMRAKPDAEGAYEECGEEEVEDKEEDTASQAVEEAAEENDYDNDAVAATALDDNMVLGFADTQAQMAMEDEMQHRVMVAEKLWILYVRLAILCPLRSLPLHRYFGVMEKYMRRYLRRHRPQMRDRVIADSKTSACNITPATATTPDGTSPLCVDVATLSFDDVTWLEQEQQKYFDARRARIGSGSAERQKEQPTGKTEQRFSAEVVETLCTRFETLHHLTGGFFNVLFDSRMETAESRRSRLRRYRSAFLLFATIVRASEPYILPDLWLCIHRLVLSFVYHLRSASVMVDFHRPLLLLTTQHVIHYTRLRETSGSFAVVNTRAPPLLAESAEQEQEQSLGGQGDPASIMHSNVGSIDTLASKTVSTAKQAIVDSIADRRAPRTMSPKIIDQTFFLTDSSFDGEDRAYLLDEIYKQMDFLPASGDAHLGVEGSRDSAGAQLAEDAFSVRTSNMILTAITHMYA